MATVMSSVRFISLPRDPEGMRPLGMKPCALFSHHLVTLFSFSFFSPLAFHSISILCVLLFILSLSSSSPPVLLSPLLFPSSHCTRTVQHDSIRYRLHTLAGRLFFVLYIRPPAIACPSYLYKSLSTEYSWRIWSCRKEGNGQDRDAHGSDQCHTRFCLHSNTALLPPRTVL